MRGRRRRRPQDRGRRDLLDYQGTTIKTLKFKNVWVQKVEVSTLKAGAAEQATEKFTVCFDESTVE